MDAMAVLKQVSQKQDIGGSIAQVIEESSQILNNGLQDVDKLLKKCTVDAPGKIENVCSQIVKAGGKKIRPSICMLAYKGSGGNGALPIDVATSCELLHNASLLHDDVIDEGDTRRGQPSARMVWGNALSVLGGDYLLMQCVEMVSALGPDFMSKLIETQRLLVEGEVLQLDLRGSINTTEQQYFKIVHGKTSSLFAYAAYTGALCASKEKNHCKAFEKFGFQVGTAFQMIDDVLDFSENKTLLGKNLLADISQGKLTLPVILAAQNNTQLQRDLKQLATNGCRTNIRSNRRSAIY